MSEQISWPVADERPMDGNAVDRRQILPAVRMRDLTAAIEHVLTDQQGKGVGVRGQAMFVAHYLAPRFAEQGSALADARLQLEQAGEALRAALGRITEQGVELAAALPDAEQFRTLTRQGCAVGVHTHWYAPSGGRHWMCPWCLIPTEVGEHLARLAEALGIEAAEDDVDMYGAVASLQVEVDRLRDEVASQPGYADRHRDCVTIGGGYCVDVHVEDDRMDADPDHRDPDDHHPDDVSVGTLCDLLSLVGVTATKSQVATWTVGERRAATRWASATHLSASDNDVDVPPRPACLAIKPPPGECLAHGPHPHAQLKCLDCPQCVDGAS